MLTRLIAWSMVMGTSIRLQNMLEELMVEMDGVRLEESLEKIELLLGVNMQCDLKWSEQIVALNSKLKTRLTGLGKLKSVMERQIKKAIVQGVFNSVLCYCLPLFGSCNQSEVHTLQVHQNRAAQIVLNSPPRTSRDWMFDKLGWMTVQQLIAYHTLIAIYRIRQSKEPEHLSDILTKDNRYGHIIMKNTVLGLYRNSFVFRGTLLWNRLPETLRKLDNIGKFKKNIRNWVESNVDRFAG